MKRKNELLDCVVIGGGPGGLSAALYLGRAHKKAVVLSSGPRRTAHATKIENYLGLPGISGSALLETAAVQVQSFGIPIILETVVSVHKTDAVFTVQTKSNFYKSKAVIVASGIDDIMPEIDNVFEYLGETLFTCLDCDGFRLTGKKTCIIGKGSAAAKVALAVAQLYTTDIVVAMVDEHTLPETLVSELKQKNIPVLHKKPVRLNGKEQQISEVVFEDGTTVACECVLSVLGFSRNDSFLKGVAAKKSERGYYAVDENYQTSLEKLYVVGPLNTGPDQVSVAVGQGARAALHVIHQAFPF